MIYTGQSGLHFAYVSSSDLNGDNQTLNDPVYIPTGPTDPEVPGVSAFTTGGVTYTRRPQQAAAFDSFISSTDCLNSQRGHDHAAQQLPHAVDRTSSTSPSSRRSPTIHGQNVSVRLDIINFGNLLNKNWGRQISTGNFNPVTLYTPVGHGAARHDHHALVRTSPMAFHA